MVLLVSPTSWPGSSVAVQGVQSALLHQLLSQAFKNRTDSMSAMPGHAGGGEQMVAADSGEAALMKCDLSRCAPHHSLFAQGTSIDEEGGLQPDGAQGHWRILTRQPRGLNRELRSNREFWFPLVQPDRGCRHADGVLRPGGEHAGCSIANSTGDVVRAHGTVGDVSQAALNTFLLQTHFPNCNCALISSIPKHQGSGLRAHPPLHSKP